MLLRNCTSVRPLQVIHARPLDQPASRGVLARRDAAGGRERGRELGGRGLATLSFNLFFFLSFSYNMNSQSSLHSFPTGVKTLNTLSQIFFFSPQRWQPSPLFIEGEEVQQRGSLATCQTCMMPHVLVLMMAYKTLMKCDWMAIRKNLSLGGEVPWRVEVAHMHCATCL